MNKPAVALRRQLLLWLLTLLLSLWAIASVATYFISVQFANVSYDHGLRDTLLSLAAEVDFKDGAVVLDLPPAAQKILEFDAYDHVYYKVYQKEAARPGRLLLGREDVAGHTDRARLLGGDGRAAVTQLQRAPQPDDTRQAPGSATIGDQADANEQLGELRAH